MTSVSYDLIYYIYILLFGVFTSMRIAAGAMTAERWALFAVACPLLLLLQGLCLQFFGAAMVWMLYPLIAHLPIALIMIWKMRVRWDAALISVCISYSLCQLPRWIGLVLHIFSLAPGAELVIHLSCSQLLLILLSRNFLGALHDLIRHFPGPLIGLGALPAAYYLYEYFMLYTQRRFASVQALNELLPTSLVLFFMVFAVMYRHESEKRETAEDQAALLETELNHASQEIASLHMLQEQTAIYRHDLRHHLLILDKLLDSGQQAQAIAYIREAQSDLESITPVRYCENETASLLLGAYVHKARSKDIVMKIRASLPSGLNLPDTELCAMLSNGLENALHAVAALPEGSGGTIDVYCAVKQNTLLIEIKNPHVGTISLQNGIPVSNSGGAHYGCRSIQAIVQRRQGVCTFEAVNGNFLLRIAIPLTTKRQ